MFFLINLEGFYCKMLIDCSCWHFYRIGGSNNYISNRTSKPTLVCFLKLVWSKMQMALLKKEVLCGLLYALSENLNGLSWSYTTLNFLKMILKGWPKENSISIK
jgi:hypothetical protein